MKEFSFGDTSRDKLLKGVEKLANAVKVTMGPKGRNVLIQQSLGEPLLTKDGVTVANHVFCDDEVENMAAKVIKQAANNTNDQAGDGTTTTTVLSYELFKRGVSHVNKGCNPVQLKRGMDKACEDVLTELKNISEPVSGDQIEHIATISANGDVKSGKLVASAVEKVGLDGVITIDTAKGFEDSVETTQGMKVDRGYLSPYFITNAEKATTEYKNPLILLLDDRITSFNDLVNLLTQVQQSGRPLLVIAEDYESDPLNTLIANKAQGALDVVAIKAPGFGDNRTDILQDIAILTNGTVISPSTVPQNQAMIQHCGSCDSIIVGKNDTILINNGDDAKVNDRINLLKEQIKVSKNDQHIKNLKNRIARLSGGIAVLKITAQTDIELKEKKDRIEDALNSCRSSIEEGIVPGSGNTLAYIGKILNDKLMDESEENYFQFLSHLSEDERIGYKVVVESLSSPLQNIYHNSGIQYDGFLEKLTDPNNGINALTGASCLLKENGIIDPAKVERVACENAVSVASSLLTTECTITNKPLNR